MSQSDRFQSLDSNVSLVDRKEKKHKTFFEIIKELGVDTDQLNPTFFDRLERLDRDTKTVDDELRAIGFAEVIFEYLETIESPNQLSPEHQQQVKLATLLTDIGKTGPLHATDDEQEAITAMYDLEFPIPREKAMTVTIETFLDMAVDPQTPGGPFIDRVKRDQIASTLQKMKLQTKDDLVLYPDVLKMPMRIFWNLHARWTFDLLNYSHLSPEVTATAANHHMLEGVNPITDDSQQKRIFDPETQSIQFGSISRPIDQREIFVILLDKYDASLRRGNRSHTQAVEWLRLFITTNQILKPHPKMQQEFLSCLDDLDLALQLKEEKFAKAA